jgi:hypothetical protein
VLQQAYLELTLASDAQPCLGLMIQQQGAPRGVSTGHSVFRVHPHCPAVALGLQGRSLAGHSINKAAQGREHSKTNTAAAAQRQRVSTAHRTVANTGAAALSP